MSPVALTALSLSMSIDAFIAALGRGAASELRPGLATALRTGLIFGAVEGLTPLLGWAGGLVASRHLAAVDHWIAFALLAGVGASMALRALRGGGEAAPAPSRQLWTTVLVALGTSIDALVVGVSLAFVEVNILLVAAMIGLATLVMSAAGMIAGRHVGQRCGRLAEGGGGLALIGLGTLILHQHLAAG